MKNRRLGCAAVAVGLILVVLAIIFWPWRARWEEALRDANPAVRAATVRKMPRDGYEQVLIDAINDENADVRLLAVQRLGDPGPQGAVRGRALCRALNDDHAGVRREAAWSLSWIGPDAWQPLRNGLADEIPRVRAGAALALDDVYKHKVSYPDPWPSQEAEALVPVLTRLLSDADPEVRRNARWALRRVLRHLAGGWYFPLSLFP